MSQRASAFVGLYTATVTVAVVALGLHLAGSAVVTTPLVERLEQNVFRDGRQNDAPTEFVAALPEKRSPRVLILGSSQLRTVRDSDDARDSFAARLGQFLPEADIIDMSAGGQQIVDAMALLEGWSDRVQPDVVVIGVSLYGALQAEPRDTLQAKRSKAKNLQEKFDQAIAAFLADHIDVVGRRREIYHALVETPIRRDLRRWLQKARATTARTFPIGPAYPEVVQALRHIIWFCNERGISLLLIDLPFDDSREPKPYRPADRAEFSAMLREIGEWPVDATSLLSPEHFGNYQDGSPDALHFDAAGHELLAQELAQTLDRLWRVDHAL